MDLVVRLWCIAAAVVLHSDSDAIFFGPGPDNDILWTVSLANPILHCVLYNGLEGQGRQIKGQCICVELYRQLVAVKHGLHCQISLSVTQLLPKGYELRGGDSGKIGLKIGGEIVNDLHGLFWLVTTQLVYGNQRVIYEVWPDLVHHRPDLFVPQFFLPLS